MNHPTYGGRVSASTFKNVRWRCHTSVAVPLVRKKDGSLQFCIDFQWLNKYTKKDAYPLPRTQEQIELMVSAKAFLQYQLEVWVFGKLRWQRSLIRYTAFTVGSMGIYKFPWMPFGLCNVPATFQHLMQNCLGKLNLTYTLIYLDSVIVFSCMPEEHLIWLRAVLEGFLEHGLKLKLSKV